MFELIAETDIKKCTKGICTWCGESLVGLPAVKVVGKFEGDFCQSKYHPECNDAVSKTAEIYGSFGFDPYQGLRGKPADDDSAIFY